MSKGTHIFVLVFVVVHLGNVVDKPAAFGSFGILVFVLHFVERVNVGSGCEGVYGGQRGLTPSPAQHNQASMLTSSAASSMKALLRFFSNLPLLDGLGLCFCSSSDSSLPLACKRCIQLQISAARTQEIQCGTIITTP
jgi:hypothetical protein